jgi:D-alanyl-D-alanine carboxypeptidase/D-alanyl-D-alanine-endopeptidase (penicillin-binding protein 4)
VLVASGGDFSFGLRDQPDGTLRYATLPVVDHNEANAGLPGEIDLQGDPWAALDSLAGQVKAAGIDQVNDVAIDDRVFEAYRGWSDGVIAPIWFNENLVDVSVTPGAAAGDAPAVTWRPETAAYTVRSNVTTVAQGQATTPLSVSLAEPGVLQVDGQIEAGGDPLGRYYLVDDPSAWARTGFVEALGRAGVAVTAAPTGPNPAAALPAAPYDPATKVAEHTSATLGELVKVVQKVSFNRGADLLVCLTAVQGGSTACPQGLIETAKTVTALGIPANTTYQFDGAGSDERSRTSPGAMAAFLQGVTKAPWAKAFEDSLPILGVDGTLGNNQAGTPAAGHVFAKTGTRAAFTSETTGILTGLTQVGYIDTAGGRRLTYGVMTRDIPLVQIEDIFTASDDQGVIAAAIYSGF